MAAESELASLYVRFATKGDKPLDKAIDAKKSRLQQAAAAAQVFGKSLAAAVGPAIDRLGSLAQKGLVVGGILKGIVLGKGMEGTKEAETMGNAFTLLSRVIADIFHPVIAGVTQAIIELSGWFVSLDQETKDTIVGWTLLAGAFAGALALLPVLKAGISALGTAFAILSSKIVLIPALIFGVIAAVLYLTAEGDTFEERSVSVLSRVMKFWAGLKAVLLSVWESIKAIGVAMYRLFTADFEGAYRAVTTDLMDNWKQVWANAEKEFATAGQRARNVVDAAKAIKDTLFGINANTNALVGDDTPLGRILAAFKGNKGPLRLKMEVEFMGGQQMWERMMKAMSGDKQDRQIQELENIRRGINDINNKGVRINNMPPTVVA